MQVIVNGKPQELAAAATLASLLEDLELGDAKVATALNGTFVPASRRGQQGIEPGDRIEIVAPMQGG